ncbi:unnamed protein product [Linum tenue]|uniref:Transcription repressor n=1 Tax=Linum tenue TaxID=586396 RepID=A0AAV0RPH5_9ROSI|nr:unnamed protein product [Linum tenue]
MPTVPFFWRNLLQCLPTTTAAPDPLPSEQPGPDPPPPATSSSILFSTNYNSIFDISSSTSTSLLSSATATSTDSSESDDSHHPPDFATVFASHRFFFSSPGLSSSIISNHDNKIAAPNPPPLEGGVAVKKYSPDPYADFKKSMVEMIESRRIKDARGNWDYLHELLSCYLDMNPKNTHCYIIAAFADIVVRLLSTSPPPEVLHDHETSPRPLPAAL